MEGRSKLGIGLALISLPVLFFMGLLSLPLLIGGGAGSSSGQAAGAVCVPAEVAGNAPAPTGVLIKGQPITGEQANNARIIIGIGARRGFTARDVKIALMVAIQESSMRNLRYGHLDSLGMFQQRSTWGSVNQRLDPVYSTNKFYDAMATIPNREQKSLLDIALAVQRPSRAAYLSRHNYFPGWESTADQLLGGSYAPVTPDAESCSYGVPNGTLHDPGPGPQDPSQGNLRPRAVNLQNLVKANWGCDVLQKPVCVPIIGGWRPTDRFPDHPGGYALDIVISNAIGVMPVDDQRAFGWQMACFMQANAEQLGIQYLIWQGKIWNLNRPSEGDGGGCGGSVKGWRTYTTGFGVTQGHYDHIHVTLQLT